MAWDLYKAALPSCSFLVLPAFTSHYFCLKHSIMLGRGLNNNDVIFICLGADSDPRLGSLSPSVWDVFMFPVTQVWWCWTLAFRMFGGNLFNSASSLRDNRVLLSVHRRCHLMAYMVSSDKHCYCTRLGQKTWQKDSSLQGAVLYSRKVTGVKGDEIGVGEVVTWPPQSGSRESHSSECLYSVHFLIFMQSRTPAHGMTPPTFNCQLSNVDNPSQTWPCLP